MSVRLYKSDSFSAKYQFLRRMNCNSHGRVATLPLLSETRCVSTLLHSSLSFIHFCLFRSAHCREIGSVALDTMVEMRYVTRWWSQCVSVKIGHTLFYFMYIYFFFIRFFPPCFPPVLRLFLSLFASLFDAYLERATRNRKTSPFLPVTCLWKSL